jgi:hypothetical protein
MTNGQVQLQDNDMYIPGVTQSKIGVTVFLFGGVGTWKTTWAGTWPSPLFFSVGAEGGDDALAMLPYVANINPPPVYQIKSVKQIAEDHAALPELQGLGHQDCGHRLDHLLLRLVGT